MSARGWAVGALGTLVWAVASGALFSGSTGMVRVLAWVAGEGLLIGLAVFVDKVKGGSWTPAPPQPYRRPRDDYAEHQRHLADQARMAYLTNPGSQPPPPTDNFPGF